MKRIVTVILLSLLTLFVLQGCSSPETTVEASITPTSNQSLYQAVTLKVEDSLKGEKFHYYFNGFVGNDTLAFQSFERKDGDILNAYHPAQLGYTFTFKHLDEVKKAEIVHFDRTSGTVTLKLEMNP